MGGERAKSMLKKSSIDGNWCFLSNCHLSVNLLPELENILDELIAEGNFQSSFRIFMSASSTPGFPISLLQRSIKMATEPPRGIKPNFIRMYSNMNKSFTKCEKDMEFRKACYGLVWFHAMMIERSSRPSDSTLLTLSMTPTTRSVKIYCPSTSESTRTELETLTLKPTLPSTGMQSVS